MWLTIAALSTAGAGLLFGSRRRSRRRTLADDPRAIAGPCCHACAEAQRQGLMTAGTTCSPCAHPGPGPDMPAPFRRAQTDAWLNARIEEHAAQNLIEQPAEMIHIIEPLTTSALLDLYPLTLDGRRIDWTRVGEASPYLLALRDRVRARLLYCIGAHEEADAANSWRAANYLETA